jgi:hypothetical protein
MTTDDYLTHTTKCRDTKGRDPGCPAYFVLTHPDGDQHCSDCHGDDPDGPRCGHYAGCPGC